MNIFYEESGQFKVAAVVQKNDATYQADTQHGKRTKIKATSVFVEFNGSMDDFLAAAQAEAAQIDTQLLWEVSGENEFSAEQAATEYYGGTPSQTQLAATLIALYAAPMYFHKKNKGVFKAAPAEILQQALAAIERKAQQEAQMQAWIDEMVSGSLPDAVAADLAAILHQPDKQSLPYKAYAKAADALKKSFYELAKHTGGIASLPEYLQQGFEIKNFPQGTGFPELAVPLLPENLPEADVSAFSIDDADTTEIDDALSVTDLGDGRKRIGIHIAAPALAVAADSPMEEIIAQRQSTVYFPGGKITMLPENWLAAFSLDEGGLRPAFSIYFEDDGNGNLSTPVSRIERVRIADNLRIQTIEPFFNSESGTGNANNPQFPHHADLIYLLDLAHKLQKQRDRFEENTVKKYDYSIDLQPDGRVGIVRRERGSPIDTLVSEMMILANTAWAKMLHDNNLPGLFRVQPAGRVRMSTQSEPHIGMNVQHYGWFTSPLRRASDTINQQQLQSLLQPETPPRYQNGDSSLFAALGSFETAYAAYREFQDSMEAYWSLVWLQQENIKEINATVLRDDLVRIDGLPLVARATGIPLEIVPRTPVKLAVGEVDTEKQFVALKYLNIAGTMQAA